MTKQERASKWHLEDFNVGGKSYQGLYQYSDGCVVAMAFIGEKWEGPKSTVERDYLAPLTARVLFREIVMDTVNKQ